MDIGKVFTLFLERILKAQRGYEEGELKNIVTTDSVHRHNHTKGKLEGLKEAERILIDFAKDIGLTSSQVPTTAAPEPAPAPAPAKEKDSK